MRPVFSMLADAFIVLPTVVVSLGRHPLFDELAGVRLVVAWAWFEAGLEIDL